MRRTSLAVALLFACSSKTDTPTKTEAAAKLAVSAEPAGITWKKLDQPFGTIDQPDTYQLVEGQLEGSDGTVIMMQSQNGIGPDLIDTYLSSYDDVQKRDAPKYAPGKTTKGELGGAPAALVEASFDNGTAFVTRDYLVFAKGKVVNLASRTPKANAANLAPIIDHVARSLVVK